MLDVAAASVYLTFRQTERTPFQSKIWKLVLLIIRLKPHKWKYSKRILDQYQAEDGNWKGFDLFLLID